MNIPGALLSEEIYVTYIYGTEAEQETMDHLTDDPDRNKELIFELGERIKAREIH
jgi:hypothetical protein